MIDLLRTAAAHDPEVEAVVARGRSITYGQLVASAEELAAGLADIGATAVGCAALDPIDVVALLAASSIVGVEACVYPRDLDADGIAATATRLGHDTVVVDERTELAVGRVVSVADLRRSRRTLPTPAATPLMVLTTGTSGVPKGVRHDWSRLVAGVHVGPGREQRWLLAYNLNQFASFQVLLHAFAHASTIVVPTSSHARDAVEAMHDQAVTHVSATPTFWRLLVRTRDPRTARIPLQQITLGGEATPEDLLRTLTDTFPAASVAHVYAGTEFGSAVSVADGRSGLPVSILDRGDDADVRFRVVDDELQVRSRSAMLGYVDGPAPELWHRTGDLVEERDGRLHFVGRTTEMINVGGAKVFPLPIENLVLAVDGVVMAAVHGAPNAITGQIVAVDVVAADGADLDAVKAEIQRACSVLPAPGRPRRIRFVEELRSLGHKTIRSNKEGAG